MTGRLNNNSNTVVLANAHRNPKENFVYYDFFFQAEQKDVSPDNCEKNLDKCVTTYNNYQETHSGNKQGQTFTPKDLRCMNSDRLKNPLIST